MSGHLLSWVIFLPLLFATVLLWIPRRFDRAFYFLGVGASALTFALSLHLFGEFIPGEFGFQFQERVDWISSFGISYFVGIDGVGLVLVVLSALLTLVALLSTWTAVKARRKEFVIACLVLETAMIGTFAAMDVFLFYVFWEAVLVPMYMLIGVFGGKRRIYATLKFFLYTMAGSVLMLVGLLTVYSMHITQFGFASTSIPDLLQVGITLSDQMWLFILFFIAFAIKIPIFPFHTWLPDAHVEAPTAGSIILAGVLLKMGGYGLIRLAIPLFPLAAHFLAPWIALLAVVGIIYGGLVALAQEDVKKLIAYSSVSHMGFVVLGLASLNAVSMGGAVFVMIAHGITTGALFLLVGMVYERRHTRLMADFGGLAKSMPWYAAGFLFITLGSIGLPGLCGFVGEFLVLNGSFHALVLKHPAWLVGFSVLGIVIGAGYMLWMFERVFYGPLKFEENKKLQDLKIVEVVSLVVPIALTLWLGVRPGVVLSRISPAMEELSNHVQSHVTRYETGKEVE